MVHSDGWWAGVALPAAAAPVAWATLRRQRAHPSRTTALLAAGYIAVSTAVSWAMELRCDRDGARMAPGAAAGGRRHFAAAQARRAAAGSRECIGPAFARALADTSFAVRRTVVGDPL